MPLDSIAPRFETVGETPMPMTVMTRTSTLALAVTLASAAAAQSTDPITGPAVSSAGSATAKAPGEAAEINNANEAAGGRATSSPKAAPSGTRAADATSDAPLVAQPVIRAASLIRPVTGTAAAGPTRPRLDIVDAGREDVGPLATSLRADPVDQRLPTGFDRVYRVPGSESLLMRGNGALFAVFEESVYRRSGAVLPPGTVFHIGMPDLRPTEYGLGHPPGDTQIKATSAVGRRGAIGNGPIDLRVRPAQPGSSDVGRDGTGRPPSRAVYAPITLESALGIAPRSSAPVDKQMPATATSTDATAQVEHDLPIGESHEDKLQATPTDPYAYLRLGPARIARVE